MSRYLTPKEKRSELNSLRKLYREAVPGDEKAGRGFLDAEMIPFLERLNEFRGVCTAQSCAGHRVPDEESDPGFYTMPGSLWLRLSKSVLSKFRASVGDLVGPPHMKKVSLLYHWDGEGVREIVDLEFMGKADGEGQLGESMTGLLKFLGGITSVGKEDGAEAAEGEPLLKYFQGDEDPKSPEAETASQAAAS